MNHRSVADTLSNPDQSSESSALGEALQTALSNVINGVETAEPKMAVNKVRRKDGGRKMAVDTMRKDAVDEDRSGEDGGGNLRSKVDSRQDSSESTSG